MHCSLLWWVFLKSDNCVSHNAERMQLPSPNSVLGKRRLCGWTFLLLFLSLCDSSFKKVDFVVTGPKVITRKWKDKRWIKAILKSIVLLKNVLMDLHESWWRAPTEGQAKHGACHWPQTRLLFSDINSMQRDLSQFRISGVKGFSLALPVLI